MFLLIRCLVMAYISWNSAQYTSGANVLVLHPMFAPSHVLAIRSITQRLVQRGHSVSHSLSLKIWYEDINTSSDCNHTEVTWLFLPLFHRQVTVVRMDANIPVLESTNTSELVLQLDNLDGKIPLMSHEKPARWGRETNCWPLVIPPCVVIVLKLWLHIYCHRWFYFKQTYYVIFSIIDAVYKL